MVASKCTHCNLCAAGTSKLCLLNWIQKQQQQKLVSFKELLITLSKTDFSFPFLNFPLHKYGLPYLQKTAVATRAALPISTGDSVCSIFGCRNNGVAATIWDFSYPQMLMRVTAHGGCMNIIQESTCAETHLWEKNTLLHQENQACISIAPRFFVWGSSNQLPCPLRDFDFGGQGYSVQ